MLDQTACALDIADVAPKLAGAHVLVTGGTGFLGGRLVERLVLECGAKPRVLLRNHSRVASLARIGLDRIVLVKGELGDAQTLSNAVAGCSVVFHCAMDRGGRQSNIIGIDSLVAACIKYSARLIHVSTLAVYEPLPDGDLDESMPPSRSGSRYSEMKLEVEEQVMDSCHGLWPQWQRLDSISREAARVGNRGFTGKGRGTMQCRLCRRCLPSHDPRRGRPGRARTTLPHIWTRSADMGRIFQGRCGRDRTTWPSSCHDR